jgi:hypothetical protein
MLGGRLGTTAERLPCEWLFLGHDDKTPITMQSRREAPQGTPDVLHTGYGVHVEPELLSSLSAVSGHEKEKLAREIHQRQDYKRTLKVH